MSPSAPRRRRPLRASRIHWPRLTRDTLLVGLGAAGFVNEVFLRGEELPERFYILAACVTLMGLAPILRLDERRQGGKSDRDD